MEPLCTPRRLPDHQLRARRPSILDALLPCSPWRTEMIPQASTLPCSMSVLFPRSSSFPEEGCRHRRRVLVYFSQARLSLWDSIQSAETQHSRRARRHYIEQERRWCGSCEPGLFSEVYSSTNHNSFSAIHFRQLAQLPSLTHSIRFEI